MSTSERRPGIRLLGPVCLLNGGTPVPVRGQRQMRFLAALALSPGHVVTNEAFIEDSWGAAPPRTVTGQIQTTVWKIRTALDAAGLPRGTLASHGAGYRLDVPADSVDAAVFRRQAREARTLFAAGSFREAGDRLDRALRLWRGPALADVTSAGLRLRAEALDRERAAAAELRALVAIELGCYDEAIAELSDRLDHDPLREDLYGGLMRAYYRAGRPADSIRVFRRAESALREQIGVAPGRPLVSLMRGVLRRDEEIL
ncbi:positive regulator [Streptomyces armeniacus]|uniref:Positive regulator n=1 Tax=Streptomyces armeniacus TaxID=83291 RepID=A0A345XIY2_9ACTN|nr:BTAD domain-containing putative transcriptional regulator [Streptomyces armeniacus]AXK31598.1 positive regulator [Streptomyces armeniacus]